MQLNKGKRGMTNAMKTKNPDLNRRDALRRLGLAVGAAYMAPTLLSLSNAHASSDVSTGTASVGSVASVGSTMSSTDTIGATDPANCSLVNLSGC